MTLVRWQPRSSMRTWEPFHNLDSLQSDMNRLFNWAFGQTAGDSLTDSNWVPPVDVIQEGDRFRVRVDMPGMKKDEIEITLDGDTLTVRGEKKRESETKQDDYYRAERLYGTFQRSLTLPDHVDAEKIEANYKDGVLDITIPKTESAKPKQIKIQS